MSNFGKKILSAFVDIEDSENEESTKRNPQNVAANTAYISSDKSEKFNAYFSKLFKDSNMPGPDYYEFSKMADAMQIIPDEKTRYLSAFAGLSVQGLTKDRLVESAAQYLKILDADAENFNSTLNVALQDKVEQKRKQLEEKSKKIQELTREIQDLNNSILVLGNEIKENEEKIKDNQSGYTYELQKFKSKIEQDVQKIKTIL